MDRWTDWLLRGRDAHLSDQERRNRMQGLNALRDRILAGARLNPDDRVLDVGAGTGLVALGAASQAGADGLTIALDISQDALDHCQRQAAASAPPLPLHCVGGDATHVPFPDGRSRRRSATSTSGSSTPSSSARRTGSQ